MKLRIHRKGSAMGICVAMILFASRLAGQISPGELAGPHSHLEGLSNCTKCHTLGEKVSNEKCLACHLEIGERVAGNRGYHASADLRGKSCTECHSDHHGRNFQMIRFDTDQFDHAITGYALLETHGKINCRDCHKSEFISDPGVKAKSSTYLGLERQCLSCHPDYHQATLPADCASCHDFRKFRPAPKFDHNRARFTLLGKHTTVDCARCHRTSVENGKEMQQFRGIPFGKCTDCHSDIHENKFGQNCTQCHTVESFHQVGGISGFDHSLTDYTLEGRHRQLACATCHKTGYVKNPSHNLCSDCHSDYHWNQFMVEGKSPDCSGCHSVQGFERSNFTIERHNLPQFPLTGAHVATPCFACHKKTDRWSFREIGRICIDCHTDAHAAFLDKKYYPGATCENCHTSKRWGEVSFDHSKTGYLLEGAHQRQSCRSCHYKTGGLGLPQQQFSGMTSICTGCHKDVHQQQFEGSEGKGCLKCHDYFDWSASLFDHSRTEFPLDGRHKEVACIKCHPRVTTAVNTYIQYKLESFRCESCH